MRRAVLILALSLAGSLSAEPIRVGETVTGTLASGDARTAQGCLMDQFTLEISSPEALAIDAESESVDLVLELLDPVGRCWRNDDASRDTVNPRLTVRIDTPGSCLLTLHAFHPREQGEYRLRVERVSD